MIENEDGDKSKLIYKKKTYSPDILNNDKSENKIMTMSKKILDLDIIVTGKNKKSNSIITKTPPPKVMSSKMVPNLSGAGPTESIFSKARKSSKTPGK